MTAASSALARDTTLRALLAGGANYASISAHLDSLPPEQKLAQVLAVKGSGVKKLYEAVDGAPKVSLDEFLPPSESVRIYEGRNSLLLFTRFQKRFHRLPDGTVVGYNHQFWQFLTGPGYFVTLGPRDGGPHADEILFDYTKKAPGSPPGWPPIRGNESGFASIVYGGMQDYCRKVASNVVVGKAYRGDVDRDAYFSLTWVG
jgi:hypothetical protein